MKIKSEKLWNYIFNLAPNEKVKFRVYYDDNYLTNIFWDGENFNWESGMFTSGAFFNPLYDFEIIEEDKKIEKIDKRVLSQNLMIADSNAPIDEKWKLVQKLIYDNSIEIEKVKNKLNELIDVVNELKVRSE